MRAYRRDVRSEEQFKKDVKVGTKIERDIMDALVNHIQLKTGKVLDVVDNGCGNDGEFLEDEQVSTEADFIVEGSPLEVKFVRPTVEYFHMKKAQVRSYVKQNAHVLQVMGWDTDSPKFTMFSPTQLKKMLVQPSIPVRQFGLKQGYRIWSEDCTWIPFEGVATNE